MTEEKKDEDLKLNPQDDGSVVIGDPPPAEPPPAAGEGGEDERLGVGDEHGTEDEQGHANETAEEAEARRQRNRERRAQNKERRKDFIEQLKREISARDELIEQAMKRLETVEQRSQGADLAALDNEIKKTADAYNYFKQQIDLGTREQNGAVVADATEKLLQAQRRYEQLNHAKKLHSQREQTAPPLDPRLKANAEAWLAKNPWYDLNGKDEDSFLVKSIDSRLAQEGWNPATEAYWNELDARVKKYLPHRANSGHNKGTQAPKPPVAGSGRDNGAGKGTGAYRLSAERVQALKDSGKWDDPKARAEMIRRYQDYDKQNAA